MKPSGSPLAGPILHVVHGFPPEFHGGTEDYVCALARVQRERGLDARVLTGTGTTAPRAHIEETRVEGIPVARLLRHGLCGDRWNQTDSPEAEGRIRALLAGWRPAVVHLHHWVRLCRATARLAAAAGRPVVWTLHDLATTCPRFNRVLDNGTLCRVPMGVTPCLGCAPALPWQHREELAREIEAYSHDLAAERRAAVRLIAPSRAQRDFLAPLHDLPLDRYTVLPHGTLHALKPPLRHEPDPAGRLRLVHWGYWYRDKGVHVLLDALARLEPHDREQVHLTIHGKPVFPDYGEALLRQAEGLPVTWAGAFSPETLDGSLFDVAVLPSLAHESHSFVLDEAFGLGLAVIGSRIGALPERIGEAGTTFLPGDAGDLARCIRHALRDPGEVARWRASVPRTALSMTEHAERLEALYRDVVATGPPPDAPPPPCRSSERRLRERTLSSRELEIARLRGLLADGPPGPVAG